MADSILRYFSQRLLSAILKWNQGRWGGKILQYLAVERQRLDEKGSAQGLIISFQYFVYILSSNYI